MNLFISSNAKAYGRAISRYAEQTGKTFSEALAREGPDFRNELFNQFHQIHPKAGSIFEAAKARGYRVHRQNTFLVPTANGLSQRAINRAKEILDGQKSDWFRWIGGRLAPVRFSARKTHRILQGGRSGRRFAASALRAYQLSPDDFARVSQSERYKSYGAVRLNLRALATYLELTYRERGARGGTMAVQWLFKTWKRGNSKQRARLVQRSATGVPIGEVDFEFDRRNNLQAMVFSGFVPGTVKEAQKHEILDKVFSARTPALMRAIELHHQKVAKRHGF